MNRFFYVFINGYRFDGKGGMKTLTGVLTFVEDPT